jgi:hypothetical protein
MPYWRNPERHTVNVDLTALVPLSHLDRTTNRDTLPGSRSDEERIADVVRVILDDLSLPLDIRSAYFPKGYWNEAG